jgi:AcrR family transcriptional regulator
MSKAEITKEKIIQQAATLFNSSGYAGTSMSELMKATGLQKGGIYNHFQSKDEILVEAFQYSVNVVKKKLQAAMKNKSSAKDKLIAIIDFYRDYPMNPVVKGGCPILNSLVDSDNSTNENFRSSVKSAVDELILTLQMIIKTGIRNNEFKKNVDPHKSAVVIFTTIEGGVAVSRNYADNGYMNMMMDHLVNYVERELT